MLKKWITGKEAMQALVDGKRIHKNGWKEDYVVSYDPRTTDFIVLEAKRLDNYSTAALLSNIVASWDYKEWHVYDVNVFVPSAWSNQRMAEYLSNELMVNYIPEGARAWVEENK